MIGYILVVQSQVHSMKNGYRIPKTKEKPMRRTIVLHAK